MAFQFFNGYLSLFYLLFWKQDFERLTQQLTTILFTLQIVGNLLEVVLPFVTNLFKSKKAELKFQQKLSTVEVQSMMVGSDCLVHLMI
jgi:hypothetical protein